MNMADQLREPSDLNGTAFGLTAKEYPIFLLAELGWKSADIARDLRISERTVKSHLRQMYVRFGIPETVAGRKAAKRIILLNLLTRRRHENCVVTGEVVPGNPTLRNIFRRWPKMFRVIGLVARGCTNLTIAHRIGTTENMVKNHMRFIYDQSGCDTRAMLSQRYLREKEAALWKKQRDQRQQVPVLA